MFDAPSSPTRQMLTFHLDGSKTQCDRHPITMTARLLMEAGNSLPWECVTGPTGCQLPQTSVPVGNHDLFSSRCWYLRWDHMRNDDPDCFCIVGVLKEYFFTDEMRWNGFYVSSSCQSDTLFLILTPSLEIMYRNWLLFARLCVNMPSTNTWSTSINSWSLAFHIQFCCPLLINKLEVCSTVSHQKNDPILCDSNVLLCASTSSIICDPVILIAYPQTQSGIRTTKMKKIDPLPASYAINKEGIPIN